MVANPQRAELARLRADVAAAREGIATALDTASTKMADGKTWTGPTAATNWAAELNGRKKNLGPWIDAVLREIDAKLRSMPEKVTSTQARADHNDLAHRGVLTCSGFVHLPGARHEQA
jgi:hypothetical protein